MGSSAGVFDAGRLAIASPYFIAGKTGILAGLAASAVVARLVQFGYINPASPAAVQLTPISISQIRLKYFSTTTPTAPVAFDILKGASSAQADSGAGLAIHIPQRRKTGGYPAIAATETSLAVAGGVVAISGGNFTPLDATGPLDTVVIPGTSTGDLSVGSAVWSPSDLTPLQLEAGEAIEIRNVSSLSGAGVLLVAFDFVR